MSNEATKRQVAQIAKAISNAFAASGLPAEILRDPKIELTTLPWQLPPLQTNLSLQGYDLGHLLMIRVATTAEKLHHFWSSTLHTMKHRPGYLYYKDQYRNIGYLMPSAKANVRAALFAHYEPDDEMAGLMFSMEIANLAMNNMPLADMLSDDSNYWVKTVSGYTFGVKNGKPMLGAGDWPFDGTGIIQALLESQRGKATTTCYYDTLALARSILHQHSHEFKQDFLALDFAIQALRPLTADRGCPAVIKALREAPFDRQMWVNKVVALTEATEILTINICDRDKLVTLENLLIPTWYSRSEFRRQIFSGKNYPYMLDPAKLAAIKETIAQLWLEVPDSMK